MMRLWQRRESRSIESRRIIDPRILELEMAKQILEEVFHARPSDVEDMIQRRLEEKSWTKEEKQWPQEFCLSE